MTPTFFLREKEIIQAHLPMLRYLAHLRIIEYQDWTSQSSSSDEGFYNGGNDELDSGDSNYNGYHPGFDCPSRSSFGPRIVRMPKVGDAPAHGRDSGPAFRSRGGGAAVARIVVEDEMGWAPAGSDWGTPFRNGVRCEQGAPRRAARGNSGREIPDVTSGPAAVQQGSYPGRWRCARRKRWRKDCC